MADPGLLDHLVVALLVGVAPFVAAWAYRRFVREVEAGAAGARVREYRRTIALQWLIALNVVGFWVFAGRGLTGLGFAVPGGWRLAVGAGVTALGVAFLTGQWRAVQRMAGDELDALREKMASVAPLLPRTDREAAHFRALSVTAGVCEEVAYRGYLVWYLAAFVGPWPAALVAGILFGVLHLYQGPSGMVRTGAVGVVMALLFVASGSLLWPMILHAAIDLNGGAVARRALTATAEAESST